MIRRQLTDASAWFRQRRSSAVFCFLLIVLLLVIYIGWQWPTHPNEERQMALDGSRANKRQFQFINRGVTEFDVEARTMMERLVERKAPSRDPQLIKLVQRLLDPPPTEGTLTLSKGILTTPQSQEVDAYLSQKRNGFFVECGALDGERASNSLPLERDRQWTGVLIEANPYYYTQLLGKNRNVWSLNACLSPFNYAVQLEFQSSKGHAGRVRFNEKNLSERKEHLVPCFPLETILLALNRTQVHYLSLDIEGVELDVLKTISFDRIDIEILTVEYLHGENGRDKYRSFMESKGYRMHKELKYSEPRAGLFAEDYVFVKKRDA